jgi:hypothetical protein
MSPGSSTIAMSPGVVFGPGLPPPHAGMASGSEATITRSKNTRSALRDMKPASSQELDGTAKSAPPEEGRHDPGK